MLRKKFSFPGKSTCGWMWMGVGDALNNPKTSSLIDQS